MLVGPNTPRWIRTLLFTTMVLATIAAIISWIPGCGDGKKPAPSPGAGGAPAADRLRIYAPNPPFASLIEEMVGESAEVVAPWRAAGGDPAYWRPSAEDIGAIQSCGLVFLNGAGYEPWAEQAALPRGSVFDLSSFVRGRLIVETGETHSHGPDGEHSHSGYASTTWLSPAILRVQLREIAAQLSARLPEIEHRIDFKRGAADLLLGTIEGHLVELGRAQPIWLGSHPVYQYLAQAGGFDVESMHWEPGEMPSETEWTKFRLVRLSAPTPKAWMLWEGEPGADIRAKLAEEGVEVVVLPPLGREGAPFVRVFAEGVEAMKAAVP
jgi:zinc transport system substrate-binding protein